MMRRVVGRVCRVAGSAVSSSRRTVVIGEDEEDRHRTFTKGIPNYTKGDAGQVRKNATGHFAEGSDFADWDPVEAQMFESAEENMGRESHKEQMRRMGSATGMPAFRRREEDVKQADNGLPKLGTSLILQRYERGQVLGFEDEGWTNKAKSIRGTPSEKSTVGLYRAFWRLLRRYPKEAQPRLALLLRQGFKANLNLKYQRKKTSALKQGKELLLRYIDQLKRYEQRRHLHDPVERFLFFYAEEAEKQIENLDFYPYTTSPQEVKPIKDIGFHKIQKNARHPGSPGWKSPNVGLGGYITQSRVYKRKLPLSKSIRRDVGRKLVSSHQMTQTKGILKRNQYFKRGNNHRNEFHPLQWVR